jgi:hypothetical protein
MDCHRLSRQKGSGSRRREEQRCELEGSAVPAVEAAEPLDHFGLGAALLGVGQDEPAWRLMSFQPTSSARMNKMLGRVLTMVDFCSQKGLARPSPHNDLLFPILGVAEEVGPKKLQIVLE